MIAYCVAYIDKKLGAVLGASVFSEPNPTCSFNHHQFTLFESNGRDYAEASRKANEHLASPEYDWLGPVTENGRFSRVRLSDGRQT